ncbi:zinc finger protein 609 [Coccinella septempunctata]|uniref:zinc finger protein 609 n=1 Tax=Coccinella septempunctata TaxID=41139 RepID=UPI001D07B07D|nr:zinc finger protein 609 [Coccinella septempunctata]XP_044744101.1 zinc finger protein 609 [Coccinella septempunctata]
MAAPMRSSSVQEAGHRPRVADLSSSGRATTGSQQPAAKADASQTAGQTASTAPGNFEYDDNEWDIGIGDLIIDLDADIEKTTEKTIESTSMAANAAGTQATKAATAKMAVEHSATVDKGLKMKIKRTKPGTKTSEAKHEIVKSNEQNGVSETGDVKGGGSASGPQVKHSSVSSNSGVAGGQPAGPPNNANNNSGGGGGNSKRGSSGHRRDKARDKHTSNDKTPSQPVPKVSGVTNQNPSAISEMNGIVRVGAPQTGPPRPVFPASTGPGPPQCANAGPSPGPPPSPAAATAQGSAAKPEQAKVASTAPVIQNATTSSGGEERNAASPPPSKKMKSDVKVETSDVCVGTSIGTITEPDCLGPCEPGTSVTLEGIVWHETESGVLVVNVTWRGKTYVGTLLDCTRHDWAPPRFCDSPTSDLDNRTPKGRETRSSVHSKLRNGGIKGRRGAANGSGPSTAPSSPTPFVSPRAEPCNKRKSRTEDEAQNQKESKKSKVIIPPPVPPPVIVPTSTTTTTCSSPPPSPVLLECPEPNCSKKYKHINGLKYHQSHAHGSADDDDTKDVTSMSENDESNIEAPSPITPVKSPEKSQDSPLPAQKRDDEIAYIFKSGNILDVPSQPTTPRSTPPSPAIPQGLPDLASGTSVSSPVENKNIVKPGVLRFNNAEEFPVGVFSSNKTQVSGTSTLVSSGRNAPVPVLEQPLPQNESPIQPQTFTNPLQTQVCSLPPQQFVQSPTLAIPTQTNPSQMTSQLSPHPNQPPSPACKITNFKVKPTAALMPDEKKNPPQINQTKPQSFKKKNRKSPAGSPHPPQSDQPMFGMEQSGRDEVRSPAYSDISDDGAPVIESEVGDKNKNPNKKADPGQPLSHMSQYGMYPFYGQSQYLVPNVQQQPAPQDQNKPKEPEKQTEKAATDKEIKKESGDYPSKPISGPTQHYYPFGYMSGYPGYPVDPNYGIVQEDKMKEERVKESPSPIEQQTVNKPIPNPIQVPNPGKSKQDSNLNMKDKHQNDNHQILKESIEMKNQMNPYMYSRPSQQQPPTSHHNQREEDVRRFYVYEQRRKESQQQQQQQQQVQQNQQQQQQSQGQPNVESHKSGSTGKGAPPPSPNVKQYKDAKLEDKDKKDIKQEGVKPTMETQGPPPPPTSQYAYIHHNYMQSPHYGALHFDPNHSMYRGLMVPGPYSTNPYLLNTQIPRYHAPEDLSRAQPPTKALDMLEHHAQYYSQHKIHELQERAIKSPTPKTSAASSSPSANSGGPPTGPSSQISSSSPMSQPTNVPPTGGKQTPGANKESRSPPPQRHVHTHHHTHVGLSYPMYPAPYGAAVIASQQAAAVTVINPYPTK